MVPDLIVEMIDGEYMVFANDTSLPRLRISQSYRDVAKDKRAFTGENRGVHLEQAERGELDDPGDRAAPSDDAQGHALHRRPATRLLRTRGVQYLKPLTLREVADHIEMHESTVSRVTNKKFVQTPRGVYSLKYFFSSGLSTTSGEDISARGVRDKIKGMVADEDTAKPLTDQAIVNLLQAEGVKIARTDRGQVPGSTGHSPGPDAQAGLACVATSR